DNGGCFSTTKDVTFTCKDSYFEGNSATEVTGTSAAMGGVGNHSALGQNLNNYYNCEFVGNNARSQAGAVTQANVYNCTFKNNRSGWNGGACYVVNAYNSDFINNSSYNGGGAISAAYRLEGCYFENNTTDNNYGGAVYIVQDVISCEFVDNKAAGAGGAIAHNASWFKYVNIDDCIFNGNYSDSYGGAIYLDNSTPETGYTGVTIENCTIEGNIAKTNGAGIYVAFYNDKLNVGKTYQSNYMFIDNNYIGTNFDSPTTKESNLYIHKGGDNFDGLKLLSNLEEGSVIDIESNITFTNELIAELSGVDAFVTDSTINAFTYKGVDYDFYSKTISSGNVKTGIGIYVKPVNGSGLVYTASDNYVEYDGLAHTINVNVISPTSDYGIVYSTDENGTYSTTPITVKEPGETAVVWFKIVSDSYGESSPESRVVTVEKLDIYLGFSLLAKTWIGEVFTKDVNIPVAVSGEIFDIYGNAVACDFIPSATKTIAKGDNNNEILVTVKPKNTQKY
ncbi:MAG: hypothetical protein IKA31_01725, partial [Clostridia bacterium]|nr:hypothetical protein [Clostridia bacterium]